MGHDSSVIVPYCDSAERYHRRLAGGISYSFRGRNFIVLPYSTSVYEVSPRYINHGCTEDIERQIQILGQMGYICNCRTMPPVKIEAVELTISHACNLRCDYCSTFQGTFNGPEKFMTITTAKKAVDYLASLSQAKMLTVEFFGGEPLLNYSLIRELVSYCGKAHPDRQFRFVVTTNATLITDEIAGFFKENEFIITVSLDGYKEMHDRHRVDNKQNGSWNRTIAGISRLRSHKVRYRIHCVQDPYSKYTLDEQKDLLKKQYPDAECVDVIYELSHMYKDPGSSYNFIMNDSLNNNKEGVNGRWFWHKLLKILREPCGHVLECDFGLKKISVDPDENVNLCHRVTAFRSVANRELLFSRIGNMNAGLDFAKTMPDKCSACWAFNLCAKGCHVKRSMSKEPDPLYCRLNFDLIGQTLDYIASKDPESLYMENLPELFRARRFQTLAIQKACPDIRPLFLLPCDKCALKSNLAC